MAFNTPEQVTEIVGDIGAKKVNLPLSSTLSLGFLAGAYISFGFLLYIRVTADLQLHIWGSVAGFIGAAVFPLGLVLVLVAGGELVTGNIMAVTTARLYKKITTWQIVKNWTIITVSNFIGAIFIAYLFGHYLGLTETGPYLEQTIRVAESKVNEPFHM